MEIGSVMSATERNWRIWMDVIMVWECELKKDKVERTLEELYAQITSER